MKLRLIATALAANFMVITAAIALDANLPAYQAVSGISGQLKSVGSDTLNNEMELWAEGFEGQYPDVEIEIEGKGSATAPPALLEGASQFAPMSRPMTADEVGAFEKKYGYKPAHFRVAADALVRLELIFLERAQSCCRSQQRGLAAATKEGAEAFPSGARSPGGGATVTGAMKRYPRRVTVSM